jgi:hypothetical protein
MANPMRGRCASSFRHVLQSIGTIQELYIPWGVQEFVKHRRAYCLAYVALEQEQVALMDVLK